jgi:hypothetical protein
VAGPGHAIPPARDAIDEAAGGVLDRVDHVGGGLLHRLHHLARGLLRLVDEAAEGVAHLIGAVDQLLEQAVVFGLRGGAASPGRGSRRSPP